MQQYLIAMFLAGCACTVNGLDDCPTGFIRFGPSCYLFGDTAASFADGVSFCRSKDQSHLAIFETATENLYFKEQAENLDNGRSYWIGLTNLRSQAWPGEWRWDGCDVVTSVTDWATNEPGSSGHNYCVKMSSDLEYKWDALNCSSLNYPLCELEG